jgi:hypothetical protein
MRRLLFTLAALAGACIAPLLAAAPTLGSQAFIDASANPQVIALANVDSGNAVVVLVGQDGSGARTYTVTDECGNTYGTPVVTSPAYGTGVGFAIFASYASGCTDTSLDITVTASGSASFAIFALEVDCAGTCAADRSSSIANASTTTHVASATADVIDTAADVLVASGCVAGAGLGTEGNGGAGTLLTESVNLSTIMAKYQAADAGFIDERGTLTSTTSRASECAIVSVKNTTAPTCGSPGGPPRGSRALMGVGC